MRDGPPRERSRRPARAAESLASLVRDAPEPYRAASLWALVVGEEIRRNSQVLSCDRRMLCIRVSNKRWQATLRGMEGEILDRLNRVAGPEPYRGLRFEP